MTTKSDILKSIRHKCIDCCVGSTSEISKCPVLRCSIHPYRMGVDPNPSKRGFGNKVAAGRELS